MERKEIMVLILILEVVSVKEFSFRKVDIFMGNLGNRFFYLIYFFGERW